MLVIFDFDDTAAVENVARLLLDRFGDGEFTRIQAEYSAGRLLFRDYQELAFHSLDATVTGMRDYAAETARLRAGFGEAVQAAAASGARVAIVSAGLDFYIEPVLERHGFGRLPLTSVGTGRFEGSASLLQYTYPEARAGCPADWAVCKCRSFEAARRAGEEVVFVGDGIRSDACAAARASTVFARARLLEHCRTSGIQASPFEDLYPVVRHIESAGRKNGRSP
jgi:2-hydroxy-3-keto-5-methylthiopentenyl-1-phosphate phosphatase